MSREMARERLYLFDTTLRDGAQTNGVDFTLADKLAIAGMLDELGIDYVEGGYPGANPTDTELFSMDRHLDHTTFTAFGMTRRPGRSTSNDPGLAALLAAKADAICFVAKSWDYHVKVALETTEEENLASIRDSVRAAKAKGREVLLDCEHFFDGYKANPKYALACAKAAYDEGARWVVLCDTNGGTLPHEVEKIVGEVCKVIPGDHVGIHAHNDTEQAVANSFAAVRAGARQIQGTLNGLGERCGNANLVSLIPTLKLKPEFADRFDVNVSDAALKKLAHVSHALDERLNRAPDRHAPYVGESAFATKAGIHASAIMKDPATYEHVAPDTVDYVNAHGTGTPQNDPIETRAIKEVFGEHARRLAVSSTKSQTGHCLGAAGAIEILATVLALHHGFLPPTIHLEEPDPECDLDYVPGVAREQRVSVAVSNSYGFGGNNTSVVLTAYA